MHAEWLTALLAWTVLQVMLAQQASIAQLLGAYDELRARGGTVSGYSAGAYLAQEQHVDDLQHEHIQGKSQMKRERYLLSAMQCALP